jgi:hypothetical protein
LSRRHGADLSLGRGRALRTSSGCKGRPRSSAYAAEHLAPATGCSDRPWKSTLSRRSNATPSGGSEAPVRIRSPPPHTLFSPECGFAGPRKPPRFEGLSRAIGIQRPRAPGCWRPDCGRRLRARLGTVRFSLFWARFCRESGFKCPVARREDDVEGPVFPMFCAGNSLHRRAGNLFELAGKLQGRAGRRIVERGKCESGLSKPRKRACSSQSDARGVRKALQPEDARPPGQRRSCGPMRGRRET